MDSQQQPRLFIDGVLVIANARSVCRTDFAKLRAAAGHDVRNTEGLSDLDLLSTRGDHFAAGAKGIQDEENGGRVVVYDDCGFATQQMPEGFVQVGVPLPAP